jgi:hypothetical protein
MIKFDPHALYSRRDLIQMLEPLGIDPDAWIGRIRPKKRFRQAWFGEDLLEAIRKSPALAEKSGDGDTTAQPAAAGSRGKRRRLRTTSEGAAGGKLDAYLQELKSGAGR